MGSEKDVMRNKQYRGQIIRILVIFYPSPVTIRQLKLSLMEYGLNNLADIEKHLYYLENKGYIGRNEGISGVSGDSDDGTVSVTAKGIDLAEGTISDEGLYM